MRVILTYPTISALTAALCFSVGHTQIIISPTNPLPPSVDNGMDEFFPPIFQQNGESCGSANGIGYTFTYEIDRVRNVAANASANQYPFTYAFAFLNDGSANTGTSRMYVDAFIIAQENGIPNVVDWGGFNAGFPTKWMSGYDLYYNAMRNRVDKIDSISLVDTAGLRKLKQWLHDHGDGSSIGGVANIGCSARGWQFHTIVEGPETGKSICTKYGTNPAGDHAQTVIGYNDSIRYDVNQDGKFTTAVDIDGDRQVTMADREIGAVRIANSWGENSGIGDGDVFWLLYRVLAMPENAGGLRNGNCACIITVKRSYTPSLTLKVSLTHAQRSEIALSVGVAPTRGATLPTKVRTFEKQFTYAGGAYPMCGSGGSPTIEIGLDITDLIDSLAGSTTATFFLIVDSKGGSGTVNSLSIMNYTSGTVKQTTSSQTNVSITAGTAASPAKTYVGVATSLNGSGVVSENHRAISGKTVVARSDDKTTRLRLPLYGKLRVVLFDLSGKRCGAFTTESGNGWITLPEALPVGMVILNACSAKKADLICRLNVIR